MHKGCTLGKEMRRGGKEEGKKRKEEKKRGKVEREVRKSCHQRRQLTTSGRPTITNLFFFIAITGDDVESRTEPLSYDRSHSLRVCCFATERQCAQLVIQLRERGLLCPLYCTRVKSRQPHHIRLISSLTFTGNERIKRWIHLLQCYSSPACRSSRQSHRRASARLVEPPPRSASAVARCTMLLLRRGDQ